MILNMFPESHKVNILSHSNLENVLFTSKHLNNFNDSWVINLLPAQARAHSQVHSADIFIEALFSPSAEARILILPGAVSGRITAMHVPCQVFLTGF